MASRRNLSSSALPAYRKDRNEHSNAYSRVRLIGYFSVDGDRNYLPDSSRLLYYKTPDEQATFDLDHGRENAVRRNDTFKAEGIGLLLKWIQANKKKIKPPPCTNRAIEPNFVCSRGLLLKFFAAPYSPDDRWKILVAKWKGTIYLRKILDDDHIKMVHDLNEKFTSWGHKFEQYVLSESPDKDPDTTKPVIEPEEFRCVYRYNFTKHSVLFSTVIKGVCSTELLKDPLPLHKLKYVDLKTSRMIEHAGHEKTLRKHKFMKWWVMGFLTNTENMLCGFRDDNGVVNRLTTYNINQMVAMGQPYWNPEECIRCCETFLTKLADTVINECDETIYEFTKVSHDNFNITELQPSTENSVLPLSYMNSME